MVTAGLGTSFPSSLLGPELCPRHIHREGAGKTKNACSGAQAASFLFAENPPEMGPFQMGHGGHRFIKHLIVSQFLRKPRSPCPGG